MRYVNAGGMKVEVICSIKGVKEDMDGTQMLIQAKNANVITLLSTASVWVVWLSWIDVLSLRSRGRKHMLQSGILLNTVDI